MATKKLTVKELEAARKAINKDEEDEKKAKAKSAKTAAPVYTYKEAGSKNSPPVSKSTVVNPIEIVDPVGPPVKTNTTARYGVEEYNSAFDAYLNQLKSMVPYNTAMSLANHLKSNEMIDMSKLGFNNWNDDTASAALLGQNEMLDYFRKAGYFDRPEFLSREYITEPTTSYLTSQEAALKAQIEESKKKDDQAKWYESNLQSTRGAWEQLEAEKNNPYMFDPMYGYAMMEYLQGNREEPFNFDQWDYEYQSLPADQQQARLADLQKQWNSLDFDTLTGRNYTPYQSKTSEYQSKYDTVSGELARRSGVEAFETQIRNSPNYGKPYVAPAEDKGRIITTGIGGEVVLSELDTNTYSLPYLINEWRNLNLSQQLDNGNPIVKKFFDNGMHLMSKSQVDAYNAAVEDGGEAYGQQYLDMILPDLHYQKYKNDMQMYGSMATSEIVGPIMSAATVPMSIMGSAMTTIGAALGEDDPYAPIYGMSNTADIYREKRGEVWGEKLPFEILGEKAGRLLYNIGMSTADMVAAQQFASVLGAATGKADAAKNIMGAVMSTEVGTSTFLNDLQSGRGYEYAVLHGFTDGFISRVAESGLLDNLFSKDGKLVMNTLKAAGSEGLEEMFEEGGQIVSDAFFAYLTGQENQIQETYNYYAATLGADKAALATLQDFGNRFAVAGLSGAVMGGGTAAVANTGEYLDTRSYGKGIVNNGDADTIMNVGQSMPENSESKRIYDEITGKQGKGKKPSFYQFGQLTKALVKDLGAEHADIINRVQDDAIVERLVELGEDRAAAKQNASIIRRIARGEKVPRKETFEAKWSDNATQVVKELARETKPEDVKRAGNKWVADMEAQQLSETSEVKGKQIQVQVATVTPIGKAANRAEEAAKKRVPKRDGKPKLATDSHVTFRAADGSAEISGEFMRFEETEEGMNVVVQTGKGKEGEQKAKLKDWISADGDGVATILSYVGDEQLPHSVTAEEANTLMQVYKHSGGNAKAVIQAFDVNYLAGYSGNNQVGSVLDPGLAKIAYENGKRDAEKDEAQRKQRASEYKALENPVAGWIGKVDGREQVKGLGDAKALEEAMQAMPESQRTAAEIMIETGKAVGLNVVLYDSDGKGAENDIQNGMFDEVTHTVYFDVSAWAGDAKRVQALKKEGTLGYAMLRVGGHELTHYLEVAAPEAYAKYSKAVKDALKAKGVDFAVQMRERIDKANAQGRKLTMAGAAAEVIADASEDMLQDSKLFNNLDTDTKGKIRAFLQNFAQKVKEIFQHLTGGHKESAALREMKNGVYHYLEGLQDLWDAGFDEILAKGTTDQSGDATEMVEGQEVKYSDRDHYDFSKSFAQQVDDYKNGVFPEKDALILGRTPEIYRKIGLGDLPMTINSEHVGYIVNGTKDPDHHMGEAWLKQLPKMIENPVAVIVSDSNPRDSVVVVLATKINGQQIIAPVYVNSTSRYNGLNIDSNNIATAFGKGNALTKLLTDALNTEAKAGNDIGVYYWNKTEAHNLYRTAGLQLPGGTVQDGLIHSIFDAGSPVNSKMIQRQTDSQQFRRWFGDSVVVNEDGTPKVVYHGTGSEFTVFDPWKTNYGETSEGWSFFTNKKNAYPDSAQDYAKRHENGRVMEVYLSIKKPLRLYSDGYYTPVHYYDENYVDIEIKYMNGDYDGIIIENHDKAVDDSVIYLVQDPTQIKSATDNVGTFDPENPDIRYSDRDLPDGVTIREYLGSMKPTSSMTETEKLLLKRYQDQLRTLEEKEKLVEEQEEIIRTAPFRNPDGSLNDEITKAKNRYKIYRDQANRAARALANAEKDEGFARLMATSRQVVNDYLLGAAGNVADAQDVLESEINELTRKLTKLEADVTRTSQGQRTAFARGLYNPDDLKAAAQKLKDTYGSRMSVQNIANRLALAYGELYANEGAEGAKLFMAASRDLATDLLAGNKYRYQSEILPMLREQIGTISLSDTDLQEIGNAGLTVTEYKRMLSPYIKVSAEGSDLSSYASNAGYYGNGALEAVLGDDAEGNLAMHLYDVISQEKAKEADNGYDGMSESQLIGMAMADIAGANLPMSANSSTVEYLRKELLKYAGENAEVAITVEEAISKAKKATAKAGRIWLEAAKNTETARQAVEYYRALDEKRRVMELAEQKKQITEQLKSDTAKKLQEKVTAQREEYREREKKAREYRKTRDEVDKLRRRISRNVKTINKLRLRETDQKHVPQQLQHVADELMRTFTDSELSRLAFSEQKTASLRRTYGLLRELEHDDVHYWDDEIQVGFDNLAALSKRYNALKSKDGSVPSRYSVEGVELELEILQGVDNVVNHVLNMIDATNENFLRNRNETFTQFANKAGEKLRGHKDYKNLKGALGRIQHMLDESLRTGNTTPVYFFEHLENQEIMDVFDEIRNGMRQAAIIEREGKQFIEKAREQYNYGSWVADGKLTMKTSQGHTIELTREEACEIYAIAKREAANKLYQTEHLLYGGFNYKHIDEKGKGLVRVKDESHQLDKADIAKISSWLTEEQKAYADALVGFLSTDMADYGNDASMKMYGYKKFTEQYYIPFHTVANQRFQKGDEGPQGENAGTGRVKNSGFTHKVQYKANQALYVGGISETVADHIHKMAAYAAMVEPIENMKRLLNHKMLETDGTSNTIRALIGQKYGKASEDYMTQLLKDLNGATMGDKRASGLTDKMIGAFKRGAVMASASVVLQQPTAMTRAMAMISPKYFTNNPFYRPGKGTWEEMLEHSGTAVIKDMGKFDVGMGLTATQYILDEDLNVVEALQRLKAESVTKAGKAVYDRFMAWLSAGPGKADQWAWGLIWKAVKAEQADLHPDMDQTSDAFLDMVGERFDDVIDHTQVYDSVLSRSNLMRSQDGIAKAITVFKSEPTLSLNMLYDALSGWKNKRHTGMHRGRIIGSVLASQILAGAMAALAQAWNDDDDKRTAIEKYADRATGNIVDNLNPLKMIPLVSDIVSMCEGYDVARPDMEIVGDAINYSKSFFDKAFDPDKALGWKDYENFLGTIANMVGIPAKNLLREGRRAWNAVFNTQWTAPTGIGVGQAILENMPFYSDKNNEYYQRIVTAKVRGDDELAEDLRTYMLTSKMVKEETLTKGIREAYQARYEKGGIEKDDAINFLLENNLATGETEADRKKSAFGYVDRWEEGTTEHSVYNTLKDAYGKIDYTAISKAWKELTNYGYTDEQVKEESRKLLRKLVEAGTITPNQATQILRKWCSYKKDSDNLEKPREWIKNKK